MVLFECGAPARWVVVAPQVIIDGRPVVCLVTACDRHVLGVQTWLRDRAMDACAVMDEPWSEDFEPGVDPVSAIERLQEHFGDMAWMLTRKTS